MNHKDKHYFYTQLHLTVFAINFHLLYYPNLFLFQINMFRFNLLIQKNGG